VTSTRPYLIRAFYEWIVDNDFTPHIIVNAEQEYVTVPHEHVENGKIVLNISPSAVKALDLGNDWISFNARFGGKSLDIGLPPDAVLGIYARENGQGMLFQEEQPESDPPQSPTPETSSRPQLKVIK
jgi:stringent starvation protein B